MSLKLFSDDSPAAWKILIAARYVDVKVEQAPFTAGVDNKSKEFLAKSPLGRYPILETKEGTIFEPNAIARYIARQGKNNLYGSNAFEAGLVDQWIEFASSEIDIPANVWVYPILGYIPNNAVAVQKAKGDIRNVLNALNTHLTTKTFLVGERLSLADIVVATSLVQLYQRVLDSGFRKQFVHTNRWFTTVVNQPNFLAVHKEITLCTKMEVAPEGAPAAEQKAEKKAEPKAEKPKAKKEEAPKKKEKEPEEEEDDTPKEEKKKNPLDDLPPSKFNLDEWKRTYSNEDTRTKAIPWFWEHLDTEGWSIWIGEYKYNDECEKVFMTANLLGGFVQRLDRLRKYGFGSLCIFGQEPKLTVTVCFLVRGQELPAEMTECDDYTLYDWRKVDVKDTASRELVNDFWAWDGKFGGKSFNQGKVFK